MKILFTRRLRVTTVWLQYLANVVGKYTLYSPKENVFSHKFKVTPTVSNFKKNSVLGLGIIVKRNYSRLLSTATLFTANNSKATLVLTSNLAFNTTWKKRINTTIVNSGYVYFVTGIEVFGGLADANEMISFINNHMDGISISTSMKFAGSIGQNLRMDKIANVIDIIFNGNGFNDDFQYWVKYYKIYLYFRHFL